MPSNIAVHVKIFRDGMFLTRRNPKDKSITAIEHNVRSTGRRFGTIPVIALGIFKPRNHKFHLRKRRVNIVRDLRPGKNLAKFPKATAGHGRCSKQQKNKSSHTQ